MSYRYVYYSLKDDIKKPALHIYEGKFLFFFKWYDIYFNRKWLASFRDLHEAEIYVDWRLANFDN